MVVTMGFTDFFNKPEPPPPQPGSTIPRKLRMGARPVAIRQPTQTIDTRTTTRFVPRKTRTSLTLTGGKKVDGRVINMSGKAVAIEADLTQFKPDDVVMIGSHPVKSGRKIALGRVFLFLRPLDGRVCNEDLVIDAQ